MNFFSPRSDSPSINPEWEVSAEDLKRRLGAGEPVLVVDCRTAGERETARIEPSVHVPMDAIDAHLDTLREDPSRPIVVYCHHGVRSMRVTTALRHLGFPSVHSMAGGIDRWSVAVDPDVPRY
jgi:rhodanese-related sulfurtransferase